MPLHFLKIEKGQIYTRKQLAELWGYRSFHALGRGVFTPSGDKKIILFVTENKQSSAEPYSDRLINGIILEWDGPKGHSSDQRIVNASNQGDEIHLFYRTRHHSEFTYMGLPHLIKKNIHTSIPSHFTFQLV